MFKVNNKDTKTKTTPMVEYYGNKLKLSFRPLAFITYIKSFIL